MKKLKKFPKIIVINKMVLLFFVREHKEALVRWIILAHTREHLRFSEKPIG